MTVLRISALLLLTTGVLMTLQAQDKSGRDRDRDDRELGLRERSAMSYAGRIVSVNMTRRTIVIEENDDGASIVVGTETRDPKGKEVRTKEAEAKGKASPLRLTFTLNDKAMIRVNGKSARLSELETDMMVQVRVARASADMAPGYRDSREKSGATDSDSRTGGGTGVRAMIVTDIDAKSKEPKVDKTKPKD